MWPLAIGAGLSAIGSFIGQERANQANVRSAREQMAFQERMVGRQEAFQERMANTAVQRQMADLRAAGVNPMLAVMNGSPGAPAPQGSSAQGARAERRDSMGGALDRALQVVNSGLAAKKQKAEIDLIRRQADTIAEQGLLTQQQRFDLEGRTPLMGEQAKLMLERIRGEIANLHSSRAFTDVQKALAEFEKPGARNRARLEEVIGRQFGVGGSAAKSITDVVLQMLRLGIMSRK